MQNIKGMKHLGKAAQTLRKKKGLRLEDVANSMANYDAGNLSRFERQQQGIADDKLRELCTILGVTLSELARVSEELEATELKDLNDSASWNTGVSEAPSPPI